MTYKPRGGLTIKQERFVRAYLRTGNATAAYREAYVTGGMADATVNREGHELLHNHKIAARVDELEAERAAVEGLDETKVLGMLLETYQKALELEQTGPAARCAELIGKAVKGGMFTDRHQHGQDTLTREQIIDRLAEGDPTRRKLAEQLINVPESFEEAANEATEKRWQAALLRGGSPD